jgi:hypothetical protein
MRTWGAFLLLVVACDDPVDGLEWITPTEDDTAPIGDAVELAVTSPDPDAIVTFAIDGVPIGVCDPGAAGEDCKRDDAWRWTTVFGRAGTHVMSASYVSHDGVDITIERSIAVVRELVTHERPDFLGSNDEEADTTPVTDDLTELAAAGRGVLDPDRGFHRKFGGIAWAVKNQRVKLKTGTPHGSVAAVKQCMNRFGKSIRRWADHYKISRGSVVATALTESNCTNPAGSSDGLSSGPMQVTGSTCAAITGLSRNACRKRMHTNPDFSFRVGAKYIGSSFQRNQHRRDPPKIAAAYNAGSLQKTFSNRWHMVSTGNHIDRFVRHYNAYRVWESQQ